MDTVRLTTPVPPDADFDAVRGQALAVVQETQEVAGRWTDHNAADPGITLLEAGAWAYADLHYRTAERRFDAWSAEAGARWRSAELPLGEHDRHALALAFSVPANAAAARAVTAAARSRAQAVQQLRARRFSYREHFTLTLGRGAAEGVVRLLREPLVLRAALDRSTALERAVADATTEQAAREAVAAAVADLGIWEEEAADLVAFVRRAAFAALLRDHAPALRALVDAAGGEAAALTALAGPSTLADGAIVELADLPSRRVALAVHPCPPVQPELWEHHDGATTLWPPHALQARTCEPVTLDDYRRLALAADGVRRAWALPGLAAGVAWDGRDQAGVPARRGAVTLLVEGDVAPKPYTSPLDAADRAFLRGVLRQTLASPEDGSAELDDPLPDYRDSLTQLGPRRLLGDELCAALVTSLPVVVAGTLEVSPTADGVVALAEARRRLQRFLSPDREAPFVPPPEPSPPLDCPRALDGPWPRPQAVADFLADPEGRVPAGGWHPGDPVRASEIVQLLTSVPGVLGADRVRLQEDGAADWESEVLPLPRFSVPAFARDCLVVHVLDPRECGA